MRLKTVFFSVFLLGLPLLLAFFNFPYLLQPTTYLYGYPSDKLTAVWEYWEKRNLAQPPWDGRLAGEINQWGYNSLRDVLAVFVNEVSLHNLLYLLVFELAFLSLYLLAVHLTRSRPAAAVAAVIYASSQYFLWHTMQNMEISLAAALLPLFFWLLGCLEEALANAPARGQVLVLRSLGAAIIFSLIFLISFYVGYFTVFAAVVFIITRRLYSWWEEKKPLLGRKAAAAYLFLVLLSFFGTLPGTSLFLRSLYEGGNVWRDFTRVSGWQRNTINDLIAYGARPWDYLLPSPAHPFFGRGAEDFYQHLREKSSYQFWSIFLPERPNYLTLTALLLAVYAVCRVLRRCHLVKRGDTFTEKDRRNVLIFAFLALAMFFVSLPAVITIKGINIYLPSFFLFKLFPMFRVYARAGVFVLLGVAILAGYGWKVVLEGMKNKYGAALATVGVLLAIIFENLNFPPFPVMNVGRVPAVYSGLHQIEADVLIVEYPKDNSQADIGGGCPAWLPENIVRDYNPAYEFFYQRVHRKRLFGYQRLPPQERAALGDLSSSRTYEILSRYGVDYVLVHTQDPLIGIHSWPYPQENPLDECWQRRVMQKPEKVFGKFKLVAEFEDGVIYQL